MGMYALAPLTSLNQFQCKSISVKNKIPAAAAAAICHSSASGTRSITLIMQQTVQL